jgi:hypothetical protein
MPIINALVNAIIMKSKCSFLLVTMMLLLYILKVNYLTYMAVCSKDLLLHNFQDPTLCGSSAAPTPKDCTATMLVLLMVGDLKLQKG